MYAFERIAGVGCACDSVGASGETAFAYLKKVNDAVEALDHDVTGQTAPGASPNQIGQAFLGAWNDYVNGALDPTTARGWREFVASSSSLLQRTLFTEEIIENTGGYEHRFNELHREFVKLGGKPSGPELVPGPPSATLDESAEQTFAKYAKGAAIFAGLAIAAYVVVNVAKPSLPSTWRRE